jgi:hypothetical protein
MKTIVGLNGELVLLFQVFTVCLQLFTVNRRLAIFYY